ARCAEPKPHSYLAPRAPPRVWASLGPAPRRLFLACSRAPDDHASAQAPRVAARPAVRRCETTGRARAVGDRPDVRRAGWAHTRRRLRRSADAGPPPEASRSRGRPDAAPPTGDRGP